MSKKSRTRVCNRTLAWILEHVSRKQIKKANKRAMRAGQYYISIQLEQALALKELNPHY